MVTNLRTIKCWALGLMHGGLSYSRLTNAQTPLCREYICTTPIRNPIKKWPMRLQSSNAASVKHIRQGKW